MSIPLGTYGRVAPRSGLGPFPLSSSVACPISKGETLEGGGGGRGPCWGPRRTLPGTLIVGGRTDGGNSPVLCTGVQRTTRNFVNPSLKPSTESLIACFQSVLVTHNTRVEGEGGRLIEREGGHSFGPSHARAPLPPPAPTSPSPFRHPSPPSEPPPRSLRPHSFLGTPRNALGNEPSLQARPLDRRRRHRRRLPRTRLCPPLQPLGQVLRGRPRRADRPADPREVRGGRGGGSRGPSSLPPSHTRTPTPLLPAPFSLSLSLSLYLDRRASVCPPRVGARPLSLSRLHPSPSPRLLRLSTWSLARDVGLISLGVKDKKGGSKPMRGEGGGEGEGGGGGFIAR